MQKTSLIKSILLATALLGLIAVITMQSLTPQKAPKALFSTIKGQEFSMASLGGKVVLVNFWATSCKICVDEMPKLIETYKKYHDQGFEVVAISMRYDPPAQLVAYANQKALPFPVMHDSYGEIAKQFGDVYATPTAYLYNKAGNRIQNTTGTLNFEKLHTLLEQELG